jgi:hypothetical protein
MLLSKTRKFETQDRVRLDDVPSNTDIERMFGSKTPPFQDPTEKPTNVKKKNVLAVLFPSVFHATTRFCHEYNDPKGSHYKLVYLNETAFS